MSNEMKDWMRDNELERGDPYDSGEELCCCLNNYGKLIRMSLDEMAEFLDKVSIWDNAPWIEWFDKTYCSECPGVEMDGHVYARCELHNENYPCKCGELCDCESVEMIRQWLMH